MKNYALDRKMTAAFLMVSMCSITMRSLGKIVRNVPAVFVTMFFFCQLHSEAKRSSWEGDIVWATIVSQFIGRLWCSFHRFFRSHCPFRSRQSTFLLLDGATNFRKLWSKIGEKVCAHHFTQISERFKKTPLQYFRARNVDVHLYKFFPHFAI